MSLQREVGKTISARGLTVAVAESCTGGLVSSLITDVPGASAYFLAGLVTYSNESKVRLLGVPEATIEAHGAVSEEVAREMAAGVRRVVGADIGAADTGIAGPGGGSVEKPVGLVFLAVDNGYQVVVERQVFPGDRAAVKRAASDRLLVMVLEAIERRSTRS
jgi:PncC family amidohydrolase